MQPKPEPKHTQQDRTPRPGVVGYKQSAHTNRHTRQHPSEEWRRAAETRTQAHPSQELRGTDGARPQTDTHPNTPARSGGPQQKLEPKNTHGQRITPARSGGVRAKGAHRHTHTPTPQPGVAGRSRNPSRRTHTYTADRSQKWRGTSGERTQTHTRPNTPAGSGGAQPKPQPKHKHPHHTPRPGVVGYKESAHTNTHTPQHPSQEWWGAAETRAQAGKPTPHTGTQAPHNSRKPSDHSPGTEAARGMQVTWRNEIQSPGVRLHPKACAALGLEAEPATP